MKHKPKFLKFIIIFVVIIGAAIFLMIYFRIGAQRSTTRDDASHSSPVEHSGQIYLYGEKHAAKAILEKEFELWRQRAMCCHTITIPWRLKKARSL